MEKELISIKKLLIIIVVPLILYLLNILSFVFIPFVFGLFMALLFSPLIRWLKKVKVPDFIGIIIALIIVSIAIGGTFKVVKLTSHELTSVNDDFINQLDERLNEVAKPIVEFMNINTHNGETDLKALFHNEKIQSQLFGNLGTGLNVAKNIITMTLMSLFFMVLFLAGSMNLEKLLQTFIFKDKDSKIQVIRKIEKDAFTYIIVKFSISLTTGIAVSLICYFFDVSFPIFWGLFAFLLNFIQMIGSIIAVVVICIFALVELNFTGSLLFFSLLIIGVQVLFGTVIDPILMSKSFSINTVTVLIMLAVWGIIWGIPGLILSVPITALLKRVFEQFPGTKIYAKIMS